MLAVLLHIVFLYCCDCGCTVVVHWRWCTILQYRCDWCGIWWRICTAWWELLAMPVTSPARGAVQGSAAVRCRGAQCRVAGRRKSQDENVDAAANEAMMKGRGNTVHGPGIAGLRPGCRSGTARGREHRGLCSLCPHSEVKCAW